MKVKDIMTADPNCCLITDTAHTAAQIMKKDDVGAIPVVESGEKRKLAGIVTDRDLCLSVVAAGKAPDSVTVRECMSGEPVACYPEDDIHRVSDLMKQHQVRRIPVIDRQNCICGIVAISDIARAREFDRSETGEVIEQISRP
ncbi:MAG TPA: CBS domain-containing protein [Candidatus Binataceae bacterium]|nr:CBS domain-containing protein [Candidatus Binataceae bacterium]